MRALLVVVALLAAPLALAQTPEVDSTAVADSLIVVPDSLVADSVVVGYTEPPPPAPEPRVQEVSAPQLPQPTTHAFAATGLRVTLPLGWDGPTAALDADAADYALYTFTNATPDDPLFGTVLRVERVQGLNALLRERFRRGLTTYGYHGSRPVGQAGVPLPGVGLEIEGAGTRGAVAFLQSGPSNWTVQIEAPASVWASRRGEVLAVLAGVAIP